MGEAFSCRAFLASSMRTHGSAAAMERGDFVAAGQIETGPREDYFTFLDGEHAGRLRIGRFRVPAELGYTSPGRVRVSVEVLEASQS